MNTFIHTSTHRNRNRNRHAKKIHTHTCTRTHTHTHTHTHHILILLYNYSFKSVVLLHHKFLIQLHHKCLIQCGVTPSEIPHSALLHHKCLSHASFNVRQLCTLSTTPHPRESCVWHDSFRRVAWPSHKCDMTHSTRASPARGTAPRTSGILHKHESRNIPDYIIQVSLQGLCEASMSYADPHTHTHHIHTIIFTSISL